MKYPSQKYIEYMQSDEWKELAQRVRDRDDHMCRHCHDVPEVPEVHHLTYERLGRERMSDLISLCPPCHREADKVRKIEQSASLWERRVNAWSRKYHQPYYEAENSLKRLLRRIGKSHEIPS